LKLPLWKKKIFHILNSHITTGLMVVIATVSILIVYWNKFALYEQIILIIGNIIMISFILSLIYKKFYNEN
jgi:Mn2+/Fe2+ NRAMP family transporter